jgi:hypothetical protein
MMGGLLPETCWASYKYEIIFWYTVASSWVFYVNYSCIGSVTDEFRNEHGGVLEWYWLKMTELCRGNLFHAALFITNPSFFISFCLSSYLYCKWTWSGTWMQTGDNLRSTLWILHVFFSLLCAPFLFAGRLVLLHIYPSLRQQRFGKPLNGSSQNLILE